MSFWEKALGGGQQPAVPAAPASAPPTGRPWWDTPAAEPPPQQVPQQQGYQALGGQQLAVGNYTRQEDQVAGHIANTGYIRKPPQWVQNQPTLRCQECDGVNYDQKVGRCFDCGFTTRGLGGHDLVGGRLNEFSGIMGGGPVIGSARQTPEGGANLKNFGLITG